MPQKSHFESLVLRYTPTIRQGMCSDCFEFFFGIVILYLIAYREKINDGTYPKYSNSE